MTSQWQRFPSVRQRQLAVVSPRQWVHDPTRRPAGHLRGDVNRPGLYPDAAVPAAEPHFRLVRGGNIRDGLAKTAGGMLPVIRTEAELADFERPLARVEGRHAFGAQWTRSTSDNRVRPQKSDRIGRSLWPQSVLNDD
jgi:hypothetical protein